MKVIQGVLFHAGSREELLPGLAADFPYIASRVELEQDMGRFVPWHWHKAVELFYMEDGALEYFTPQKRVLFPAGSGGLVNSNVLHMTKPQSKHAKAVQFLHIFDASLLAGAHDSRISQKYILPVVTAPQLEILALSPDNPAQEPILKLIREAFRISEREPGYEIRMREMLSGIWLAIFGLVKPLLEEQADYAGGNHDKVKQLIAYIYEHYSEKISVPQLAASAFISERECFRVFHECLRTTPAEYLKRCRLQAACQMLVESHESVSAIGYACGLGSSSYFGKVFRECMGCTPLEYRLKWQDRDRGGQ